MAAETPVPHGRCTNMQQIAELEGTVKDLEDWMLQKQEQIVGLLLAAETERTTQNAIQQQLEEYEQELRSMKIVLEQAVGIARQFEKQSIRKCNVGVGPKAVNPTITGRVVIEQDVENLTSSPVSIQAAVPMSVETPNLY